jgi:hypothetical protein
LKHGRHPSLNFPFQLPAMAIKASMALTPPPTAGSSPLPSSPYKSQGQAPVLPPSHSLALPHPLSSLLHALPPGGSRHRTIASHASSLTSVSISSASSRLPSPPAPPTRGSRARSFSFPTGPSYTRAATEARPLASISPVAASPSPNPSPTRRHGVSKPFPAIIFF